MDEKISFEAISNYAGIYSEKVMKGFFLNKDTITGSEILTFSSIQQVNLFIVRELFNAWKDETAKIKSPYFNYENQEVKEALENLMNLLSKNILVAKEDFFPLLKKAVTLTLLIVFDPYDYYSMTVTGNENRLFMNAFKEDLKYLKINKRPLEKMVQRLEEKGQEQISGNEALSILDSVLEEVSFTPEDIDEYIEKFSIVAPLDPSQFLTPATSQLNEQSKTLASTDNTGQKQTPHEEKEKHNEHVRPKAISDIQQVSPAKPQREQRATLADNFLRNKKIKESLTINQKFMFTKVLFHGDFELFSRAVERLDQFDNLSAALRYIEEEHASTWDRESEEFHEFMELIERRFA